VGGGDRRKPPHRPENNSAAQGGYKRIARPNAFMILEKNCRIFVL